jgi:hypothetical protein
MRRSEFEHAIRVVGSILGTDKVLVIGSQASTRASAPISPRRHRGWSRSMLRSPRRSALA